MSQRSKILLPDGTDPTAEEERELEEAKVRETKQLADSQRRLEAWAKIVGLVVSVLGLVGLVFQISFGRTQQQYVDAQREMAKQQLAMNDVQKQILERQTKLLDLQQAAEAEKRKVNFSFQLTPSATADGESILFTATMKNHSTRTLHPTMYGARIYKKEWGPADTIQTKPDLVLYSDTHVDSCPPDICNADAQLPHVSLVNNDVPIELAGSATVTRTMGPYHLGKGTLSAGVYFQGIVYVAETDESSCVVAGPPLVRGAFPKFCLQSRRGEGDCYLKKDCNRASHPITPFALTGQMPQVVAEPSTGRR